MVGWHHQLDGHGFRWTPGAGDGQGGLACCSSWDCKESDMTERLNRTVKGQLSGKDPDGQGSLVCYSLWSRKELDMI